MQLTIGMACYDDFHGVYFTVQSLRMHQGLGEIELVVVDNNPSSEHGKETRKFIEGVGGRYIPFNQTNGTAATRNYIFEVARGDCVLVMDCHVILPAGTLSRLVQFYESNPNTKDLYQGPMIYDDFKRLSTHFDLVWRAEMWGVWARAWVCKECGYQFQTREVDKVCKTLPLNHQYRSTTSCHHLAGNLRSLVRKDLPWAGHEQELIKTGMFEPLGSHPDEEPFEIPAQGLGLFTCRRDAWLGFNPNFRGFGGEEGYIHEKFRQAGHQTTCLPFLQWLHRFPRPGGPLYPLTLYDKVRNYVIGHQELGLDLEPVRQHFKNRISVRLWEKITADPINFQHGGPPKRKQSKVLPPGSLNVEQLYQWVLDIPRDLDQHLPKLRELADRCSTVVEFTKRRESTAAFVASKASLIVSYNQEANDELLGLLAAKRPGLEIRTDDSLSVEPIECDLLFIDSIHTADRITKELDRHADKVKHFIVIHDTATYGQTGQDGGPGLGIGLQSWSDRNPQWFVAEHYSKQHGLTVLSCLEEDRPDKPIHAWPPGKGPGTELKKLLGKLGFKSSESCDCNHNAMLMDIQGPTWCRENINTILDWLKKSSEQRGILFVRWAAKRVVLRAIRNAEKTAAAKRKHLG